MGAPYAVTVATASIYYNAIKSGDIINRFWLNDEPLTAENERIRRLIMVPDDLDSVGFLDLDPVAAAWSSASGLECRRRAIKRT
jgi:hypothetical protein